MTGKTDYELLELAAKATGIEIDSWIHQGDKLLYGVIEDDSQGRDEWNPLEDDGDALRLACSLKMDLSCGHAAFTATWFDEDLSETHEVTRYCHDSDESERRHATRRAIVRAAAAIGEKMP